MQVLHDVEDLAAALRVEADHGLVEREHLGAHRDDARQRHTALLSARQVERRHLRHAVVVEPHHVERVADGAVDLPVVHAEVARAEGDVGAHRLGEELVLGVLRDEADEPAELAALLLVGGREPVDGHRALRRQLGAVAVLGQGRLARAGVADDRNELAVVDREADVVERGTEHLGRVVVGHVVED